jgi:hypothetical protein
MKKTNTPDRNVKIGNASSESPKTKKTTIKSANKAISIPTIEAQTINADSLGSDLLDWSSR